MALRQRRTYLSHLLGAIALALVSQAGTGSAQPALPAPTTVFAGGSPQLIKLTSAGDRLYFADYFNQRLGFADVDASGAIGAFALVPFKNPSGQPARPGGLAVCPSGRVVVVEHPTGTVTAFHANLSVIGSAPSPRATTGAGPLNAVVCIARGASEWAYVNQDAYWTYVVQPDPDDYESMPFTAKALNEVVRYSVTDTAITLSTSTQTNGYGSGPFANPASPTRFIAAPRLVASPDGTRLFVTNAGSSSVTSFVVNADGALAAASTVQLTKPAKTTGGLAIDHGGDVLYVALGEYSPTPGASQNYGIQSFAIAADGKLSHLSIGVAGSANSPVDGLAVHPNGQDLVLAAPEGSGNVHIVDRYTLANVYQPIPGLVPTSFDFDASGTAMYVGRAGGIARVNFPTHSLSVTSSGAGTVAPGSGTYLAGSMVSLAATPAAGSAFLGWSGACGGTVSTCTVLMDADRSVIANFGPATSTFSVTMNAAAGGTSTPGSLVLASTDGAYVLSCANGGTCSTQLAAGKSVTLTATPASGAAVTGWSNCVPAPSNPNQCTVTTTSAATAVGVTFGVTAAAAPVNVTISVGGSGTVGTCVGPATCTAPYVAGSVVTLPVQPSPGWVLKSVKNCVTVYVNGSRACRFTVSSSPFTVGVGFYEPPPPEE